MKNLLILIVLSLSIPLQASVRVMTFNTTCSVCEKGKFDKFKYRKDWIVDTIKRADPDIISMQEVLLSSQLKWFKKKLKDYSLTYYRRYYIFAFADPALFVKKDRFTIRKAAGFWLGPRGGRFSLGWKRALPRRIQYNILYDKKEAIVINNDEIKATCVFKSHVVSFKINIPTIKQRFRIIKTFAKLLIDELIFIFIFLSQSCSSLL